MDFRVSLRRLVMTALCACLVLAACTPGVPPVSGPPGDVTESTLAVSDGERLEGSTWGAALRRGRADLVFAYVPATAREIAETAIHLHGGIGLTWEYPLNAHMRRIVRLGTALGSVSGRRLALFDHFQREDAADGAGPAMAGLQQDGVLHDSAL